MVALASAARSVIDKRTKYPIHKNLESGFQHLPFDDKITYVMFAAREEQANAERLRRARAVLRDHDQKLATVSQPAQVAPDQSDVSTAPRAGQQARSMGPTQAPSATSAGAARSFKAEILAWTNPFGAPTKASTRSSPSVAPLSPKTALREARAASGSIAGSSGLRNEDLERGSVGCKCFSSAMSYLWLLYERELTINSASPRLLVRSSRHSHAKRRARRFTER